MDLEFPVSGIPDWGETAQVEPGSLSFLLTLHPAPSDKAGGLRYAHMDDKLCPHLQQTPDHPWDLGE